MVDLDPKVQAALQRGELKLRWYQARLGFWQAIWGTLITGGLAVAIPAAADAFKNYQERKLKEQEITLKERELEGKVLDSHQQYISNFLSTALNQDIELRIRFSEYFSFVSDIKHRDSWEKFRAGLVKRRDDTRRDINFREVEVDKLRVRRAELTVREQTELARLERELSWSYGELGYVRRDSNVTAPAALVADDYGKNFNGPLRPVSTVTLTSVLGEPSDTKASDPNSCNMLTNSKIKALLVERAAENGEKLELIKPAAESLDRIIATIKRVEPELAETIVFSPSRCAIYSNERRSFDASAWRVSIAFSGPNRVALTTQILLLFAEFNKKELPVLGRLERIAKYFHDEGWYWGGGDLDNRRPAYFVVSEQKFNEWMAGKQL